MMPDLSGKMTEPAKRALARNLYCDQGYTCTKIATLLELTSYEVRRWKQIDKWEHEKLLNSLKLVANEARTTKFDSPKEAESWLRVLGAIQKQIKHMLQTNELDPKEINETITAVSRCWNLQQELAVSYRNAPDLEILDATISRIEKSENAPDLRQQWSAEVMQERSARGG